MDGAIAGALRRGAMRPSRECYRQKMIFEACASPMKYADHVTID
jgi:hypothetical protein